MSTIKQYSVYADPETGEWLTEPRYIKDVDVAEWNKLEDTPHVHHDCFEEWIEVDQSETRAIEMRWATPGGGVPGLHSAVCEAIERIEKGGVTS